MLSSDDAISVVPFNGLFFFFWSTSIGTAVVRLTERPWVDFHVLRELVLPVNHIAFHFHSYFSRREKLMGKIQEVGMGAKEPKRR